MDLITHLVSYMGLFTLLQSFIPPQLLDVLPKILQSCWKLLFPTFSSFTFVDVPQYRDNRGYHLNTLYNHLELYIGSLKHAVSNQRLFAFRSESHDPLSFTLAPNETIEDTFNGAAVWWTHQLEERESPGSKHKDERKSFTLKILKHHRDLLLSDYFDHVSKTAQEIERLNSQRYLYTNVYDDWTHVPFNHPSTFDTLALDPKLKDRIKADLDAFMVSEDYYHRVGRAWKRGYLLYGPPGTGKSSMIAAMANYLNYDVYDLELGKVSSNSSLRSLLTQTSRKSLIIIEDIDCTIDLSDRSKKGGNKNEASDGEEREEDSKSPSDDYGGGKVTLSGLLNFTDGLWSCCGEERIFVFTTNHKERLDPALLRAGCMDLHILLSFCSFPAFKMLARNYLGIQDHKLYPMMEKEMENQGKLTPAEIAEILMERRKNPDAALQAVIHALRADKEDIITVDGGEGKEIITPCETGGKLQFLRKLTKSNSRQKRVGFSRG